MLAGFSLQDKGDRDRFLEGTFLLADTSMEVVLEMPSPLWCGHGVCRELVWKSYTMQRPCPLAATKRFEFIDKSDFRKHLLVPFRPPGFRS